MITILDLGLGNMGSVRNMFKRAGIPTTTTSDPGQLAAATKIVLPGVGAFDSGMSKLAASGLVDLLNERVIDKRVPTIGICLGMQLLTEGSEEGTLPGLGWIPGTTLRFRPTHPSLKIPHMGWNRARPTRTDSLFRDAEEDARYYFVHSYRVVCTDDCDVLAWTEHGEEFPSAIQRGNIYGTQFHPEKSHRFGLRILRNFAGHC